MPFFFFTKIAIKSHLRIDNVFASFMLLRNIISNSIICTMSITSPNVAVVETLVPVHFYPTSGCDQLIHNFVPDYK